MDEKDRKNPKNKKYPKQELHSLTAKEPEALYETQASVSFEKK